MAINFDFYLRVNFSMEIDIYTRTILYFLQLWKGHALAEKANARMDFSYVPWHLGEF